MPRFDVAVDEPGRERRLIHMTVTHADKEEARRIAACLCEVPIEWVKLGEQASPLTKR